MVLFHDHIQSGRYCMTWKQCLHIAVKRQPSQFKGVGLGLTGSHSKDVSIVSKRNSVMFTILYHVLTSELDVHICLLLQGGKDLTLPMHCEAQLLPKRCCIASVDLQPFVYNTSAFVLRDEKLVTTILPSIYACMVLM